MSDIFLYRDAIEHLPEERGLAGYHVEATDGHIGTVLEAHEEGGGTALIVSTGHWIGGRKVMLPAGVVERIDAPGKRVYVNRSKAEIKAAPEFDERTFGHPEYREEISRHYAER